MACPILPHAVDTYTVNPVAALGTKYETGEGKTYRYGQFADSVAYAAGQCVWWDDRATYAVTNDESSAEDDGFLAGIVAGAPPTGYYGLIQTGGLYEGAKKTPGQDSIAPGTRLIGDNVTPTDGTLYPWTGAASTAGNPTNAEILATLKTGHGFCVATDTSDDSADTVDVEIFCESK